MILKRITKTITKTLEGRKGFLICFAWNPRLKGILTIHQIGSETNSAIFTNLGWINQTTLSSWWILCPSIYNFMQNIFGAPEVCCFNLLKSCWWELQFCLKFTQHTVKSLWFDNMSERWRISNFGSYFTEWYLFFLKKIKCTCKNLIKVDRFFHFKYWTS